MVYKVILLEEAKNEVLETALFYKTISPSLSLDLLNKFFENLSKISERPLTYQTIRKEYRKSNLKRFPYKIIFRIVEENIIIVAFSHQKRKPYYWKNR